MWVEHTEDMNHQVHIQHAHSICIACTATYQCYVQRSGEVVYGFKIQCHHFPCQVAAVTAIWWRPWPRLVQRTFGGQEAPLVGPDWCYTPPPPPPPQSRNILPLSPNHLPTMARGSTGVVRKAPIKPQFVSQSMSTENGGNVEMEPGALA